MSSTASSSMSSSRFEPDLDWQIGDLHFKRDTHSKPGCAVIPVYDIFDSPSPPSHGINKWIDDYTTVENVDWTNPKHSSTATSNGIRKPSSTATSNGTRKPSSTATSNGTRKPSSTTTSNGIRKPSSTATTNGIRKPGSNSSTKNGFPRSSLFDAPEVAVVHTIFNTGTGTSSQPGPSGKPKTHGGVFGVPASSTGSSGKYRGGSSGSPFKGVLTPVSQLKKPPGTISIVDPSWELIDPTPDIYAMFMEFNKTYFDGILGSVTVDWSPRMTTCAGICKFSPRNAECKITLSQPLLKLRPRKDLVETLLHEMIHAKLFLVPEFRGGVHDRSGHGEDFQRHMHRINQATGAHITIYHTFHDEVSHYKTHWWQCVGPCRFRPPYFGMVKRSMNRPPGPSDLWHAEHQANCGGSFIKVREPPKPEKKKKDSSAKEKAQAEIAKRKSLGSIFKIKKPGKSTASASSASSSQR